jgi:serine/threonine protein phosphatase PrpC
MLTLTHTTLSDVGKVRKANEDNAGMIERTDGAKIFVVCDGMGGHVGGATASKIAVTGILQFLENRDLSNCETAISEALIFANQQVYANALNNPDLHGMGTTCVLMVIKDDECYFGHVGDSRIYLHTERELHRLTKDHSYVQQLVDMGEITDDQAESHPRKNQIMKALGIAADVQPELGARKLSPKTGDRILMCTDGLNGMINDKQIASILLQNMSREQCAQLLIKSALEHGGKDNVTATVIDIEDSPHEQSVFLSRNPVGVEMKSRTAFYQPTKKTFWKKYQVPLIIAGSVVGVAILVASAYVTINSISNSRVEQHKASEKQDSKDKVIVQSDTVKLPSDSSKVKNSQPLKPVSVDVVLKPNKGESVDEFYSRLSKMAGCPTSVGDKEKSFFKYNQIDSKSPIIDESKSYKMRKCNDSNTNNDEKASKKK